MDQNKSNRIAILDYVRAIAIACVVLCHSAEHSFPLVVAPSHFALILYSILFAFGRIGVPLFLFLTGALVLNKKFSSSSDVIGFYKSNLVPLLVASWLWTVIYLVISIATGNQFSPISIIKILLFLDESPLTHFWYLPMIIGVYIALPFVSVVVNQFKSSTFVIPIILLVLVQFFIPFLSLTSSLFGLTPFSTDWLFDISFLGGCYGFYILMGFFIFRRGWFRRIPKLFFFLIAVISFCIIVYYSWFSLSNNLDYSLWYSNFLLMICSVSIFVILCKNRNVSRNSFIESISKNSFGIYLVHMLFIDLFTRFGSTLNGGIAFLFFCLLIWIFALLPSYCISLLTSKKFPITARYLFDYR